MMMMDMEDHSSTDGIFKKRRKVNPRLTIIVVVVILLAFVVGLLIGRYATCPELVEPSPEPHEGGVFLPGVSQQIIQDGDPEIREKLINGIKSDNIRNNLRNLTRDPHLAGTPRDEEMARMLKSTWESFGLDEVVMVPYEVLLSYPNTSDPNVVQLLNETNDVIYESPEFEEPLIDEDRHPDTVPPFNAYSGAGDVTSDRLIYVNYGRLQDYEYLEANTAVNISHSIVIARYGKIFRGDKVKLAEERGALGIIMYSDPADYAMGDTSRYYPDDWWLPPSGAQRGSVYVGNGDPLTPDYPSIATAYRTLENETEMGNYLPSILAHPIGYEIAQHLLRSMDGETVQTEWQGSLNLTYRLGGKLLFNRTIRMKISTTNQRKISYNTVGFIKGLIEPDRYVILGNHRDAWGFGAIDPSSGTAVLMEIARVMGNLIKAGTWRPRRSIIFCSWGAEEYGLIGSTEWVEEYIKSLASRAVAYLNVDIAIQGNYSLRALGTPLIYRTLFQAAKQVPNPNPDEIEAGRSTVYDTWLHSFPWDDLGFPSVGRMGSASDYAAFVQQAGIPSADIRYTFDPKKYNIPTYPLYHSVYETFYAVDQLMDRGFHYQTAVGRVCAEAVRILADNLLLPFNVSDYARVLKDLVKIMDDDFGQTLRNNNVEFDNLIDVVENFTVVARSFHNAIENTNRNDPLASRLINDQMMLLDRAFIDPSGQPGRPLNRHMVFGDSSVNHYAGAGFPGLVDAVYDIENSSNPDQRWKIVKKHFSVLVYTIHSAASTLRDVTNFMRTEY